MDLVFVDLETTGGVATRDRITEIAIVRYRDGEQISRYQTLVNPEQPLTPFITKLTGLTDAMLATQPMFGEVAQKVQQELSNAIFVAHNARFDYGFLKQEFARSGIHWQSQNLCTVKLSRTLYPQYSKHGLDQLIKRHQLHCEQRHRAMGDALATLSFFQHACDELGQEQVMQAVEGLLQRPSLPPALPTDELDGLPSTSGVYLFQNAAGEPLFMGHGRNLFQAISGRFQTNKGPDWHQEIAHINYQQCAGEFSAQLSFLTQVQTLKPLYQHQRAQEYCSIRLGKGAQGVAQLSLVNHIEPQNVAQHYGLFQSQREALKALRGLAKAHRLPIVMDQLELPDEIMQQPLPSAELYQVKLETALMGLKLKAWPWQGPVVIAEKERFTGIQQAHLFEHWCYLGSLSLDGVQADVAEPLRELYLSNSPQLSFDKSLYSLLQKRLAAGADGLEIQPLATQ